MSLQCSPIWRSRVDCATPLDRRHFLACGTAAALALSVAAPLRAKGPQSYPLPDRELMAPVKGGRVYVRINGGLDGPRLPVVFIHGRPGGNHAAYLNALALSDERAVIQYDEARPVTLAQFAARVSGAEFGVVPGAAHGFFNDRPQEALGLLRPWLRREDPV